MALFVWLISVIEVISDLSDNERQLLTIIRRAGSLPRSEVSRHSPLAQQSVHRLLDGLCDAGLIVFGDAEIRGRGKPSPSVTLNERTFASIGLSLTAEAVRYSLVSLSGAPLAEGVLAEDPSDREAILKRLEALYADWSKDLLRGRNLVGLGLAVQGEKRGGHVFRTSGALAAWDHLPLGDVFGERLGLPVHSERAASCSALAEGFATGTCLAYLCFSREFSCGLLVGNRLFQGGQGRALALHSLFALEPGFSPDLSELVQRLRRGEAGGVAVADLSLAELDSPALQRWLDDVTPRLRLAVMALQAVVDPSLICFGGDAPHYLRQRLLATIEASLASLPGTKPKLALSQFKGNAAHLGAALLPLHHRIY